MTLALRVVGDVFVFVIVAGVGGFFVLLAAARFGMWRDRRRDVRTARQRHPAARALEDNPCHNPNIHADQGCPVCMVRVVYLKSLVRPLDWDRAYVEEIDR